MPPVSKPPRLHLLPAMRAPRCVVIARVRAKVWHILEWDLRSGVLEAGSWFRGSFYPMRCDVSWDGKYMVYLATNFARPYEEATWNGVCQPPWLRTVVHRPNIGAWNGGGVFTEAKTLAWNLPWGGEFVPGGVPLPFQSTDLGGPRGEDLTVVFPRFERDGWSFDEETETWSRRPSQKHPMVRARYAGFFSGESHPARRTGYVVEFSVDERPDLLSNATEWAAWDARGNLLWAEKGWLHRARPEDILEGKPPLQSIDLTGLEPPPARSESGVA
ncbi:hypothetical protein EON81_12240 [bacterium]|nr:MAG: hypothetical protein EON81_12240 [bacterium]